MHLVERLYLQEYLKRTSGTGNLVSKEAMERSEKAAAGNGGFVTLRFQCQPLHDPHRNADEPSSTSSAIGQGSIIFCPGEQ